MKVATLWFDLTVHSHFDVPNISSFLAQVSCFAYMLPGKIVFRLRELLF